MELLLTKNNERKEKMKRSTIKLTLFLLCLCLGCYITASTGDRHITKSELPMTAQNTIGKHFKDRNIVLVTKDNGFMDKSYEVVFNNGDIIEFDSNGQWKEIECPDSKMPEAIIPQKVREYLKKKFPRSPIRKMERHGLKYEVELDNGVEIKFDKNLNVKEIDH